MTTDTAEIKINGISVNIEDILSLTFSDSAGVKSDKISLKVMPNFKKPKPLDKIEVTLKSYYQGTIKEELNCGLFYTMNISRTNNKSLSFSGTGIEYNDRQKEKLSFHYSNTKLSSIVKIISDKLSLKMNFKMDDIEIKSLNQTDESYINFLHRLAKDYNCLFSIKDNYLFFVDKDYKDIPIKDISVIDCSSSNIKHSHKTFYKSCEASWHDINTSKTKKVTFGNGTPILKIKGAFINENDAMTKAKAKLKSVNKGTVSGSLSLKGIRVYAGTKVNLVNTYNKENDGIYSVISCSHSFSRANGWTTNIEIEN